MRDLWKTLARISARNVLKSIEDAAWSAIDAVWYAGLWLRTPHVEIDPADVAIHEPEPEVNVWHARGREPQA